MADIKETENNSLLVQIKSIKDDEIKVPTNIPIDTYTQEAEMLYHWSIEDKQRLIDKGLQADLIDSLPIRIEVLRKAESEWQIAKVGQEDLKKEWNDKSKEAYNLKKELLHNFNFALKNNSEVLKKISDIKKNSGHADMFQDLNDLGLLGKEFKTKLEYIKFDFTLLDKAIELSKQLSPIYAKLTNKKGSSTEAKKFRDQAYTYLKQSVDKIRDYGQFVFWKDKDRKKGYYSQHISKKNAKRSKDDKTSEENKVIAV